MLAPRYANQKQGGPATLRIRRDDEKGAPPLFVPLRSTRCLGNVTGPLAHLKLTHTFHYSSKDCPDPIEAVYRFPLPGDALVLGTTVTFGDRRLTTRLMERGKAAEDYTEARDEGKQALWLQQSGADAFTLLVAGLEPDTDIVVETSFLLYATESGQGWNLRLPLTTAPRYHRQDESGHPVFGTGPLAFARDPGHRFALDLTFPKTVEVTCSTADITRKSTPECLRIRLADGEVLPDRDLVLQWTGPDQKEIPLLNLALESSGDSRPGTFMATVTPPANRETAGTSLARELILLVDHSGSMSGAKERAADWAVRNLLDSLGPNDRFALGAFGSDTEWYRRDLAPGTPKEVAGANRFLDETGACGGTELGLALEQAVDLPASGNGETARHIIILTDAQVSDGARLLHLAGKAREKERRRVSVLCIDSAPNEPLAEALASEGGGLCEFLSSDPDDQDLTAALENFLNLFAPPATAGLRLYAEGTVLETPDGAKGTEIPLEGLVPGRPATIIGQLEGTRENPEFTLIDEQGNVLDRKAGACSEAKDLGLRKLFAARRIRHLEILREMADQGLNIGHRLKMLGLKAPKGHIYPQNRIKDADEIIRKHIVRISLAENVLSSETSFLAVGGETGQSLCGTCIVPQAAPHDWEFLDHNIMPGGIGTLRCMMPGNGTVSTDLSGGTLMPDTRFSLSRPHPASSGNGPAPSGGTAGDASFFASEGEKPETLSLYRGNLDPGKGEQELFQGTPEELEGTSDGGLLADELALVTADLAALKAWEGLILILEVNGETRLTIPLPDLARRGGKRPVNIRLETGATLRLRLQGQPLTSVIPINVEIRLRTERL